MPRSTKEGWLEGAGDLEEAEVEDVPVKGQSVKIRALSATVANGANSAVISTTEVGGKQSMKVDSVKLDIIKFAHGVIDPKFTVAEATILSGKYGPAFNRVVTEINRLSGIDEESIKDTEARFPDLGGDTEGTNGADPAAGAGGPAEPARTGTRTGDDG